MYRTCRLRITGLEILEKYSPQGRNIFAFWHGRLVYLIYYYAKIVKTPKASILVSQSRDGDYGAAIVKYFKHDCVRGSSSRGGHQAIRQLADRLDAGFNLALTPDGPRGPAFQVRPGIIKLAQFTDAHIIPASYAASRYLTLKSWDRCIVPLPFCRIHMALSDPIHVPRGSSPEEIETIRARLQSVLADLDDLCRQEVGLKPST